MYKETLKGKAHVFVLLSLFWLLFSGFSILDWIDARRSLTFTANSLPDIVVWGLHALFIGLAFHFARHEQAKPTLCISEAAWIRFAAHACGWVLFSNLPFFAFWHGNIALQLVAHGILLTISFGWLWREKTMR